MSASIYKLEKSIFLSDDLFCMLGPKLSDWTERIEVFFLNINEQIRLSHCYEIFSYSTQKRKYQIECKNII